MIRIALILSILVCFTACKQSKEEYYVASDFTADSLFTNNIEGPSFDASGNLYVVNFERDGTIGVVDKNGGVKLFVTLPDSSIANAIKFNTKGEMLLADWKGHNILKVSMDSKAVSVFVHRDDFNQPNDICINSKDQLFVSDPNWAESTGQVWRVDADGTATLLESSMGTTNGIVLSPDEHTLYVNESVQRNIWAYDVDDAGNISGKRLFAKFDDFGFDGMKVDEKGNLYATRYGKGTIAIMSPEGELIREVALKGKNCSNLVFGGDGGNTVFVTLQDRGAMEKFLSEYPGP